eukprot:TRINITY_DN15464_c0_g1_i1.p1 TRINITY_DN15464_c0_g1~~TRINITY_DN15464_c0_g1_i1.p1  ORF type:complete len:169 (-),score=46.94 TRINITY_DN15464_c0_g1_i1:252-758(-)
MFSCCMSGNGAEVAVEKDYKPTETAKADEVKVEPKAAPAAAPPAPEPAKAEPAPAPKPAGPRMVEVKLEAGRVGMRVGEKSNRVMEVVADGVMKKYNDSVKAEDQIVSGDFLVGVNVKGKWLVGSADSSDPLPEGDRAKELTELIKKLQEAAQAKVGSTLLFKKKAAY